MLVLSHKLGQEIVIDGCIRMRVVEIEGNRVRLGIEAPADIAVNRDEIHGEMTARRQWEAAGLAQRGGVSGKWVEARLE
jgi:carbon storage regulator